MKIPESKELTEVKTFLAGIDKMTEAERNQIYADARLLAKALHTAPHERTTAEALAVADYETWRTSKVYERIARENEECRKAR
jgi:hypothetical protein